MQRRCQKYWKQIVYLALVIPTILISVYCIFSYSRYGWFVIPGYSDFSHATELSEKNYQMIDFDCQESKLISTSSDPCIRVSGVKPTEVAIYIKVDSLNRDETDCQIFYANESTVFSESAVINCKLKEGTNFIPLPQKETTFLRMDLTNEEGVEIGLDSIVFNDIYCLPLREVAIVLLLSACLGAIAWLLMFQSGLCIELIRKVKAQLSIWSASKTADIFIFISLLIAFALLFGTKLFQLIDSIQNTETTYYDPVYLGIR